MSERHVPTVHPIRSCPAVAAVLQGRAGFVSEEVARFVLGQTGQQ